jgi:hypothetical protein
MILVKKWIFLNNQSSHVVNYVYSMAFFLSINDQMSSRKARNNETGLLSNNLSFSFKHIIVVAVE